MVIFIVEISLKTFSSNMMYLDDPANKFDSIVVVASFIVNMVGITSVKILGVMRLIRVVVIIIRKITGNTSKLRH